MPAAKTSARRRSRLAFLVLSCLAVPLCWAGRRVPVFVVAVSDQSAPALQQAMRAALVRATGHPEAATDPVFASLVAEAPQYVVNYQRGPQGELQVAFNGAAVDQAITALGRSVWSADRPFTLVVLSPMPGQGAYAADHAALEQAAETRGLPISIMPLTVTDSSGHLLGEQSLLALVHRFGAEQLLVGRPPASDGPTPAPAAGGNPAPVQAPPSAAPLAAPASQATAAGDGAQSSSVPIAASQWHWTLFTPFLRRNFTGTLTAGIDGTVDLLAPSPTSTGGQPAETRVRIEGVSSLADYAHIEVMLSAMPGVSRADVSTVRGDTAVFNLQARGGAAAVARLLTGSPHFSPEQSADGTLEFRYLPGSAAATPLATTPPAH